MNNTLLDISQKIEPHKAAILAAVSRAAQSRRFPFFVVGAAVRDFILQDGHDIRTPRATLDIDFGVCVSSWRQYRELIETLLMDEHFTKTNIEHRFRSPPPHEILIDILPFGAIEGPNHIIIWPQNNREMNMVGFTEVFQTAIDVKISSDPLIIIKMVSLAGLAILKLLSWNDKPLERDRDAKDFRLIMYKYLYAKPVEYVFDVYPETASIGDYDMISAQVLGKDIKRIISPSLSTIFSEILIRESDVKGSLRFVQQMQETGIEWDEAITKDISMLQAVRKGIVD